MRTIQQTYLEHFAWAQEEVKHLKDGKKKRYISMRIMRRKEGIKGRSQSGRKTKILYSGGGLWLNFFWVSI